MSSTDIPVLLLKTKSSPADGYQDIFASWNNYLPSFLPVLEHRFRDDAVAWLKAVLVSHGFASGTAVNTEAQFGAVIFTSQRAVEAFTMVVEMIDPEARHTLLPESLPLYVVGPATARGLRALDLKCQIIGEETGNGEALAAFILHHYNHLPRSQTVSQGRKLPMLFLVGEQRRDIIPRTLQSLDLAEDDRVGVHEVVVYETCEMASFHHNFSHTLNENMNMGAKEQWVVVFSPQGCKAMLNCLGWLDEGTGRFNSDMAESSPMSTYIATIGPTTRDFLIKEFGFEPHVSAEKPSPEGIYSAVESYRNTNLRVSAQV